IYRMNDRLRIVRGHDFVINLFELADGASQQDDSGAMSRICDGSSTADAISCACHQDGLAGQQVRCGCVVFHRHVLCHKLSENRLLKIDEWTQVCEKAGTVSSRVMVCTSSTIRSAPQLTMGGSAGR